MFEYFWWVFYVKLLLFFLLSLKKCRFYPLNFKKPRKITLKAGKNDITAGQNFTHGKERLELFLLLLLTLRFTLLPYTLDWVSRLVCYRLCRIYRVPIQSSRGSNRLGQGRIMLLTLYISLSRLYRLPEISALPAVPNNQVMCRRGLEDPTSDWCPWCERSR